MKRSCDDRMSHCVLFKSSVYSSVPCCSETQPRAADGGRGVWIRLRSVVFPSLMKSRGMLFGVLRFCLTFVSCVIGAAAGRPRSASLNPISGAEREFLGAALLLGRISSSALVLWDSVVLAFY